MFFCRQLDERCDEMSDCPVVPHPLRGNLVPWRITVKKSAGGPRRCPMLSWRQALGKNDNAGGVSKNSQEDAGRRRLQQGMAMMMNTGGSDTAGSQTAASPQQAIITSRRSRPTGMVTHESRESTNRYGHNHWRRPTGMVKQSLIPVVIAPLSRTAAQGENGYRMTARRHITASVLKNSRLGSL